MPATDSSSFRERRTRDELNKLLHYGHIIPISKGYTQDYVAENYPGWTWNDLVRTFVNAGVFVNRGGTPPKCRDEVAVLHFSDANSWAIEWDGGAPPVDWAPGESSAVMIVDVPPGPSAGELDGEALP